MKKITKILFSILGLAILLVFLMVAIKIRGVSFAIFALIVLVVGFSMLYLTFKVDSMENTKKSFFHSQKQIFEEKGQFEYTDENHTHTSHIKVAISDKNAKKYGEMEIKYQSLIFEYNGNKEKLSKPLADIVIVLFNNKQFIEIYKHGMTNEV